MSVKIINYIYYGSDDILKARLPTTINHRLLDKATNNLKTCNWQEIRCRIIRTFLALKFLLDKAFSNKAWANGLEALEAGKYERALGSALNWRLWVGKEASRECVAPAHLSQAIHPWPIRCSAYRLPLPLRALRDNASPARSSSPISTIYTQSLTPSLTYCTQSKPGSDASVPQG
ncbi:DNA-directed RNA polymerase subunit beta' [Ceratobasidium sp. AG-Ba]|nr:DNA-directed RNA polymerase subunit beta' [Ceratobasidium sp. AG-Ba]QRW06777.1 DNA-directed RNA polymerase subunit beta' [Ceratobasidium sp. AG-Ba]